MSLLSLERLKAAANIGRWRGWTNRSYSILEHQLIGGQAMLLMNAVRNEQIRAFMVHDMHETEIVGDVPSPDKKLYCNTMFDIACEDFDTRLGAELDLGPTWWRNDAVKWMDRQMLIVENAVTSTRPDPAMPRPEWTLVQRDIRTNLLRGRSHAVMNWLVLWKAVGGADVV